jgi:hypothetical protein
MNNLLIMMRVITKCLLYLDFNLSNYYQYLFFSINSLYKVQLMLLICVVTLNRIGKEYLVVRLNLTAITITTIWNMMILKYNTNHNIKLDNNTIIITLSSHNLNHLQAKNTLTTIITVVMINRFHWHKRYIEKD